MARFSEFLPAVRKMGLRPFVVTLVQTTAKDCITTQAAAVAYAWLFAVFPFLLFVLTLFAYIPEKAKVDARNVIATTAHRVMAREAADTVINNVTPMLTQQRQALLGLGLFVTLWIASGGMSMTMSALDTAFKVSRPRPFYTQRPIAVLLTVIVSAMILLVLILLPVGTAIEKWLADKWSIPVRIVFALTFVRYLLAVLMMFAVLMLLYTFGTRLRPPLIFFSPGAIFTVVIWILLGEGFRFYVDRFGRYEKTYGAVGGVTILLLFFYLDALVMLIGAEINSQIDRAIGKPAAEKS